MFPSQAYYQWVPFVLFLQAGLFYAPHLLCKSWEGGKVRVGGDQIVFFHLCSTFDLRWKGSSRG